MSTWKEKKQFRLNHELQLLPFFLIFWLFILLKLDIALLGILLCGSYRQFNGFFRSHAHELRYKTTIQTKDAFVPDDFFEAIKTVSVHQLSDVRASPLILHPSLDQVNGVHSCSTSGTCNGAQGESITRFEDLNQNSSFFRALKWKCLSSVKSIVMEIFFLVVTETAWSSVKRLVICFMYCSGDMVWRSEYVTLLESKEISRSYNQINRLLKIIA